MAGEKQHSGRMGMKSKLLLAGIMLLVAGTVSGVVAYALSQKGKDERPPPASPPPLPPGAVIESVSAKEVTLVLKIGGTIEEYAAVAGSVEAKLGQELQCYLPACMLTVTPTAGSVILTVVATDTTDGASLIGPNAVKLQTKPLDAMGSVLGVTIEEEPAPPSVVDVQVEVMRLAASPPPPPPVPTLPAVNAPAPPLPLTSLGSQNSRASIPDELVASLVIISIIVAGIAFFGIGNPSPNPNPNPNPDPDPDPDPDPNQVHCSKQDAALCRELMTLLAT